MYSREPESQPGSVGEGSTGLKIDLSKVSLDRSRDPRITFSSQEGVREKVPNTEEVEYTQKAILKLDKEIEKMEKTQCSTNRSMKKSTNRSAKFSANKSTHIFTTRRSSNPSTLLVDIKIHSQSPSTKVVARMSREPDSWGRPSRHSPHDHAPAPHNHHNNNPHNDHNRHNAHNPSPLNNPLPALSPPPSQEPSMRFLSFGQVEGDKGRDQDKGGLKEGLTGGCFESPGRGGEGFRKLDFKKRKIPGSEVEELVGKVVSQVETECGAKREICNREDVRQKRLRLEMALREYVECLGKGPIEVHSSQKNDLANSDIFRSYYGYTTFNYEEKDTEGDIRELKDRSRSDYESSSGLNSLSELRKSTLLFRKDTSENDAAPTAQTLDPIDATLSNSRMSRHKREHSKGSDVKSIASFDMPAFFRDTNLSSVAPSPSCPSEPKGGSSRQEPISRRSDQGPEELAMSPNQVVPITTYFFEEPSIGNFTHGEIAEFEEIQESEELAKSFDYESEQIKPVEYSSVEVEPSIQSGKNPSADTPGFARSLCLNEESDKGSCQKQQEPQKFSSCEANQEKVLSKSSSSHAGSNPKVSIIVEEHSLVKNTMDSSESNTGHQRGDFLQDLDLSDVKEQESQVSSRPPESATLDNINRVESRDSYENKESHQDSNPPPEESMSSKEATT